MIYSLKSHSTPILLHIEGLVKKEVSNAVRMASHSLDRLALFRGYIPRANNPKQPIQEIITEHRTLWKSRNRLGGLAESNAFLLRSAKCL